LDKVIRREFRLVEGDAFNAARLRRSRERIKDLDFFESRRSPMWRRIRRPTVP